MKTAITENKFCKPGMGIPDISDFVIWQSFSGFLSEKLLGYNIDYDNWGNGYVWTQF